MTLRGRLRAKLVRHDGHAFAEARHGVHPGGAICGDLVGGFRSRGRPMPCMPGERACRGDAATEQHESERVVVLHHRSDSEETMPARSGGV